jgi:DNA-directed RNA polymerase specialized sigma24 family protein
MNKEELKAYLKSYKTRKWVIRDLQLKIKELELEEISVSASTFEEHFGYDVSSSTENKAIRRLEKKEEYLHKIEYQKIQLEKIENLISILPAIEKQVIESIFLKGYSYNVVIGALDRRYSSIKEIEKRALSKIVEFFGDEALQKPSIKL